LGDLYKITEDQIKEKTFSEHQQKFKIKQEDMENFPGENRRGSCVG